jgi:RNA polymerase sigma factor (TIGR02999 family)
VPENSATTGAKSRYSPDFWKHSAVAGIRSRLARRRVILRDRADVTQILSAIEQGDQHAAAELLPLVYDELRKLAAARLAEEKPGQTLQATALVHEAYLRLVGGEQPRDWNGRGHFFAAAAEAMRRILVEAARRKNRVKRGGGHVRQDMAEIDLAAPAPPDDILALDEALTRLATVNSQAAEVVRLRFFAGLPLPEVAQFLGLSSRTADRLWGYARAWLHQAVAGGSDPSSDIS